MSRLSRKPRESRRRGAKEQAIGALALEKVRRRSGRTTSSKSNAGAHSKGVRLGISALVALIRKKVQKLRIGRSWRTRKRSGYHLALQAQKEPHQGRRHLQARNTPRGVGRLPNTSGQYSDALRALYRILLRHWP